MYTSVSGNRPAALIAMKSGPQPLVQSRSRDVTRFASEDANSGFPNLLANLHLRRRLGIVTQCPGRILADLDSRLRNP